MLLPDGPHYALEIRRNKMPTGKIKTLKSSFGFIQPDDGGEDVHFGRKALKNIEFEDLEMGQQVTSYTIMPGQDGRPTARDVEVRQGSSVNITEVITKDGKILVDTAKKLGKDISDKKYGVTTSQIRKVFSTVKKIQMKIQLGEKFQQNELILLKPKLAYVAARASKDREEKTKKLINVLIEAIDIVDNETKFQNFVSFFEAILAYHKAEGGKD